MAVIDAATAVVVTVKVAVAVPAGTVTLAGTIADALLLISPTTMPPAGATPFRVTVPVDGLPPIRFGGLTATAVSAAGLMVSEAVWLTPL